MSKKSDSSGSNIRFFIALMLALLLDFAGMLIGLIPVIGQFYAIFGVAILFILIGPVALVALVEFIPVLNIVPSFTIAVLLSRTSLVQKVLPWMQKGDA